MHKYAFFDIDNTIYDGYCTSSFYLFLARNDFIKNADHVFKRDKEIGNDYHNGKIDYAEASRQVVQLTADVLKGLKKEAVDLWKEKFMKMHDKLFSWVKPLFAYLKDNGFLVYLISAAASPPVEAISQYLKTDKFYASNLIIKNGAYSGKIDFMLNYEGKTKLIHRIIGHLRRSFKIEFGDSLGDIDMLKHMDEAFLINPKNNELISLANEEGMHIVNGEKDIINLVKRAIKKL